MSDVCMVTMAIGQKWLTTWKTYCEPGWRKYAARCGYSVMCIDAPLDSSERARKRSPSWQKCLVASDRLLSQYDQLIWVDADILINWRTAPPITQGVDPSKVGAVEVYTAPSSGIYQQTLSRAYEFWGDAAIHNVEPQDVYSRYGLPGKFNQVVHAAVMVFSPQHHRSIFEKVYYEYEEKGGPEWNYELRPLSYELLAAGVMHWLDPRFVQGWFYDKVYAYPFLLNPPRRRASLLARAWRRFRHGETPQIKLTRICATCSFMNSYFLHLSGDALDVIPLVDQQAESWRDCRI